MTTYSPVYVVTCGRNQHSTWFTYADALACSRILFKRGKTSLRITSYLTR